MPAWQTPGRIFGIACTIGRDVKAATGATGVTGAGALWSRETKMGWLMGRGSPLHPPLRGVTRDTGGTGGTIGVIEIPGRASIERPLKPWLEAARCGSLEAGSFGGTS